MKIPGISLWQPWASLMAMGEPGQPPPKTIETRGWYTPIRGWLAIAATAAWKREGKAALFTPQFTKVLGDWNVQDYPLGAVVCIVWLSGCKKIVHAASGEFLRTHFLVAPAEPERSFGNYALGRYGWITAPGALIRLTEPIPVKGKQGIWYWDVPAELERLLARLPR